MLKKNEPDPSEKPQREIFVDAVKEIGVDENGTEFEGAFQKIVPPKSKRKP